MESPRKANTHVSAEKNAKKCIIILKLVEQKQEKKNVISILLKK